MSKKNEGRRVFMMSALFVLITAAGCSGNGKELIEEGDVAPAPPINTRSPIDIAIVEFNRLGWGAIDDYVVEDISDTRSEYWLFSFSLKDTSLAPPGSDFGISVDKKSYKATVLQD